MAAMRATQQIKRSLLLHTHNNYYNMLNLVTMHPCIRNVTDRQTNGEQSYTERAKTRHGRANV